VPEFAKIWSESAVRFAKFDIEDSRRIKLDNWRSCKSHLT
jgi:hypothetical protein